MTDQRTMTATRRQENMSPGPSGGDAPASSLLEQAQGFAQVAREALRDCERGTAAVEELHRRRNQSGQ
jgi:hypothetical protein